MLSFQDPLDPNTEYLLEALTDACLSADCGGGAFAFVSPAGVRLLLGNPAFERFRGRRAFDLVVGIDAITNAASIRALEEAASHTDGLRVKVFLHNKRGSSFHPKFSWFRSGTHGTLVTGSGNLTRGGLIGNWEAFTVTSLDRAEIQLVENRWTSWVSQNGARLRSLTDPEVAARAEENARRPPTTPEARETATAEIMVPGPQDDSDVLIAEIPRGGDRWNQANFDLETFRGYFGATPRRSQNVYLYHSGADGGLPEAPEVRPSVTVRSHNFRFELEAAAHLPYPPQGRPIAVFVRVAARTFRYRLVMPGDPAYRIVMEILQARSTTPRNRMRRIRMTAADLRASWPDSPLWQSR